MNPSSIDAERRPNLAAPGPPPTGGVPGGGLQNEEGVNLTLRFYKLLRIAAMHRWNNQATFGPLADLRESVAALTRGRGTATLQAYDNNIFLNRAKLRFDTATFELVQKFHQTLVERGVGGLTFSEGVTDDELRAAMDCFIRYDRSEKRPFRKIQEEMKTRGIRSVQIHTPRTLRHLELKAAHVDQRTFVILTYAKAVRILKDYANCLGRPDLAVQTATRAQRVVQDLVDVGAQEGDRFLALTGIKNVQEYVFNHSVNVAILSILMGQRMGLSKGQIGELGQAALFHDVGKLVLAGASEKEGAGAGIGGAAGTAGSPGAGEEQELKNHPVLAFQHLVGLGQVNESLLRRILVAFECNIRSGGYPKITLSRDLHLFSRIVSIANGYDALTTPRPGRPPLLPDRALQVMWEGRGEKYDTTLLKVFVEIVGLIPLGTLVRLDTGELAVVVHNSRDPSKAGRPRVKIVIDAGESPFEGPAIDLAERVEPEGPYRRTIVGIENPLAHGLSVPRSILSA